MHKWENVHVFISSTFNDMHAERDFLLKRVFPELSEWMKPLKLNLVDVDLRWGITEKDAQENKRVVEVCLERIDECRPLFLCFLGQRRGWVPQLQDVSEKSLTAYPELKELIGSHSVTELEIMHAAFSSLKAKSLTDVNVAEYCIFCHRMPPYLEALNDRPELLKIYTDGTGDDTIIDKIHEKGYDIYEYNASWDTTASTPELQDDSLDADALSELRKGRLRNFVVGDEPLETVLLRRLKQAVS